jgi:hypothetical protein
MPRNAMPRASARSCPEAGRQPRAYVDSRLWGSVALALGLIIQMSPDGSSDRRVIRTDSRTLSIARKRAGASFLIMTRPPLRSLTGLS